MRKIIILFSLWFLLYWCSNDTWCKKIEWLSDIQCFSDNAVIKNDPLLCENLNSDDEYVLKAKAMCYSYYAKKKLDFEICKKIPEDSDNIINT